MILMVL